MRKYQEDFESGWVRRIYVCGLSGSEIRDNVMLKS